MRIFLLSHDRAKRGSTVAMALKQYDIPIAGFIFEDYRPPRLRRRIERRLAQNGIPFLAPKTQPRSDIGHHNHQHDPYADILPAGAYAEQHAITSLHVSDLVSNANLDRLRGLNADVFIHAGAGILRAPLLAIPRLGTLNAHMGILPRYRGMNVAEWSVLEGQQLGCTVHFLDPGIDTGDIIQTRHIDIDDCSSIAALRAKMDKAQLEFLAETVRDILDNGHAPERKPQKLDEGHQYFTMHPDLKAILEERLRAAAMQ